MMHDLQTLLAASAARHSHLCPRQVLGVRAGLAASQALGLELPRKDKRLLVIVETDGCFVDGIEVSTGVSVGRRTLRVEDFGKAAATFIDTETVRALRIAPRGDIREIAWSYAPDEELSYNAMLLGYQRMPADKLFTIRPVQLNSSLEEIISQPGLRACCDICKEEIINERELHRNGLTLCRACAGGAYYSCVDGLP